MPCTLALPASWAEGAVRSEQTHEAAAEIAAAVASNPCHRGAPHGGDRRGPLGPAPDASSDAVSGADISRPFRQARTDGTMRPSREGSCCKIVVERQEVKRLVVYKFSSMCFRAKVLTSIICTVSCQGPWWGASAYGRVAPVQRQQGDQRGQRRRRGLSRAPADRLASRAPHKSRCSALLPGSGLRGR